MLLTSLIFVTIELVKCVFRIPIPSRVSNPYRPPPPIVQYRPISNPHRPPVVQSRPISNPNPSIPRKPFYHPKKQPIDSYTKYKYKSILDFSSINKIHVMFSSVSFKQEL